MGCQSSHGHLLSFRPAQQRPTCRHPSSVSARWEAKKPPSTAFTMSVCAFYHATGCHHPQILFREQFFQETRPAYLGRKKHNAPKRPSLPLKVNAGPQSNVVSCLPAPRPQLEIIWVQGFGRGPIRGVEAEIEGRIVDVYGHVPRFCDVFSLLNFFSFGK